MPTTRARGVAVSASGRTGEGAPHGQDIRRYGIRFFFLQKMPAIRNRYKLRFRDILRQTPADGGGDDAVLGRPQHKGRNAKTAQGFRCQRPFIGPGFKGLAKSPAAGGILNPGAPVALGPRFGDGLGLVDQPPPQDLKKFIRRSRPAAGGWPDGPPPTDDCRSAGRFR